MTATMKTHVSKRSAKRAAIEAAGFGTATGITDFQETMWSELGPERALDTYFVEEDPNLGDSASITNGEGYALATLGLHLTTLPKDDDLATEYAELALAVLAEKISSKPRAQREEQENFLKLVAKNIDAECRPLTGAALGAKITEIKANIDALPATFGRGAYDCDAVGKAHVVRQAIRRAEARYASWEASQIDSALALLAPMFAALAGNKPTSRNRRTNKANAQRSNRINRHANGRKPSNTKAADGSTKYSNRRGRKTSRPGMVGTVATKPTAPKSTAQASASAARKRNRRRNRLTTPEVG